MADFPSHGAAHLISGRLASWGAGSWFFELVGATFLMGGWFRADGIVCAAGGADLDVSALDVSALGGGRHQAHDFPHEGGQFSR